MSPALRSLWAELRIALPLSVAVAGFFTLVFNEKFSTNLVFSLCIGLLIQALIRAGQHGIAALLRRRGVATADHWPGWGWMGPWIAVSVVLGYFLGMHMAAWLLGIPGRHALPSNPRALLLVMSIVLTVAGGTTYFFASRARLAAAEAAAAEHRLMLLQSQLEPHMLFNTLANLRVLIGLDPPRAQAMLDRLVGFLRATLQASRSAMHPLATELERLADYLALMQVRMGPRLAFALQVPDALRQHSVPPLLLQPLVENSIKHGLEPQLAGGCITVQAQQRGKTLVLSVHDNGAGLAPGAADGFGNTQVRQRLATLYGARARFSVAAAAGGGTLATITLPLDTPA